MKKPPKRHSPIYGYVEDGLKRRLHAVSKRPPAMSVSRIIEECLELSLPQLEESRGIKPKARQVA